MRTNTTQPQALMDSTQLSELLVVPVATLDQWAYLKRGPAYLKIGRHRRYRPSDVESWLDAQRRGGDAA